MSADREHVYEALWHAGLTHTDAIRAQRIIERQGRAQRDRLIAAAVAGGLATAFVAAAFDVSQSVVRRAVRAQGKARSRAPCIP